MTFEIDEARREGLRDTYSGRVDGDNQRIHFEEDIKDRRAFIKRPGG